MTLQFSNHTVRNDNSMPEFCRFQRPTMICMRCQNAFAAYPGMKRMGASSPIAKCEPCQVLANQKKEARNADAKK